MIKKIFTPPILQYILIPLLLGVLAFNFFFHLGNYFLLGIAIIGSLPTFRNAVASTMKKKISIDSFNAFALIASFATKEIRSAAFIVLMLIFAEILDWKTQTKTRRAVEELLKLKPQRAMREKNGILEEISVDEVKEGDVVVVESGSRIPVDGRVIFGDALVNESSVTGESLPLEKSVGDHVFGSTLNEDGVIKIKADRVGKDSTIERMLSLMKEASQNKSRAEKIADRFATIFLPAVALGGLLVYLVTKNISMTVSLFLVACADDMAVAIPFAMTASIGKAARKGVIVKGGEYFEILSRIRTVVLDKTGTLTYGTVSLRGVKIESGVNENEFWKFLGIAEKFSEHPMGRAIFKEAAKREKKLPDPDALKIYGGKGLVATFQKNEIVVGKEDILKEIEMDGGALSDIKAKLKSSSGTEQSRVIVLLNKKLIGRITLADTPREEARGSLLALKNSGVRRILMFTGDNAETAKAISNALGIEEFRSSMTPDDKLRELENLERADGPVVMVGDGINDAPVLARADVGIAMGGNGAAVSVEAADLVILTDNLSRVSEMIESGKKTMSVIKSDIAIWALSNLFGFALVLTGIAGPAIAAFYNFATDFFPLINSSRLFSKK